MKSVFHKLRSIRTWAFALTSCVALVCAWGLYQSMNLGDFDVAESVDLRGEWDFHNGGLRPEDAMTAAFESSVVVPKPLPAEIRSNLKDEYWYRREVVLPEHLLHKDLGLSLGSVKGRHEVYWNGVYVGAGSRTGVRVQFIPAAGTKKVKNTLAVRIKKMDSTFPGIVHFTAVSLGEATRYEGLETRYHFEVGFKPLLPAAFKLALFFLFAGLFLAMPRKREYFSFSILTLFSALNAAFFSRFMPGYEDQQMRLGFQFLFSTLSLGCTPWITADVLRWSDFWRSNARIFGASLVIVFIGASLLIDSHARIAVYQISSSWLPLLVGIPSAAACYLALSNVPRFASHRRIQIQVIGACLFIGAITWGALGPVLHTFQAFVVPEVLDMMIFAGLSSAMALEMRATNNRSDRAAKIVPKWVKGFLASGVSRLKLEIPMVAMKIDTVGYTAALAKMSAEEKEDFHGKIREVIADLTLRFGAQKLSDGGDGAMFGWDLPVGLEQRHALMREIISSCQFLADGKHGAMKFRVGLAAGEVRCELRGSDYSFLGEALNSAARMEVLATPGVPLVDESLVALFSDEGLGGWVQSELKGVVYRGRPLSLVA